MKWKSTYMEWRNMLSTQKVQQDSSITVDYTLWDDPACKKFDTNQIY
jgi:hypothetical protein